MPEKLKIEFPSQGWKQFLTGRKEMLDAFDRAREKAKSQEVETFHGRVAEAEFRKWLASFLPKKYGVTSGYVVSPGLKSTDKTPHFDVIIYDQLESPILWIDDTPDASPQGKSLAIPVEYVKAVLEVKSSFEPSTVEASMDHLRDLLPLMGSDSAGERYKLYLPPTFACGLIFFDLRPSFHFSESALAGLIGGVGLKGFLGGLILRAEGKSQPLTGRLSLLKSATPIDSTIGRDKQSLLSAPMCQSVKVTDHLHFSAMLMWLEAAFSMFAFDLIAVMEGRYESGRVSSWHGMGASHVESEW